MAESKEQRAESMEQGAKGIEQGAKGIEQGHSTESIALFMLLALCSTLI
jgi:hypothetical protein